MESGVVQDGQGVVTLRVFGNSVKLKVSFSRWFEGDEESENCRHLQ